MIDLERRVYRAYLHTYHSELYFPMAQEVNRDLLKAARLGTIDGDKGVRTLAAEVLKQQGPSGFDFAEKPFFRTCLIESIWNNHEPAWRILLEKGANACTADADSMTPLHIAAMYGHLSATEALVDKGAVLDALNSDGSTPLHLAVSNGRREVVTLLVSRGCNVNCLDRDNTSAANLAAFRGDRDLAEWLFRNGCTKNRLGIEKADD